MEIINGPTIPSGNNNIIYQITLASGMIITNPSAFGNGIYPEVIPSFIISEDGKILSAPRAYDIEWEKRQAEAIADLKEGCSTTYNTGHDFLAAIDDAIAKNEVRRCG